MGGFWKGQGMILRKTRLTYKIILQNLFFGMVPITIFSILIYVYITQTLTINKQNELWEHTGNISSSVDFFLSDIVNDLESLSNDKLIKSPDVSEEDKRAELQNIKETYRRFIDLVLLDKNGRVITASDYDYRGAWEKKAWFKKALDNKMSMSSVYAVIDPLRYVFEFACPVRDSKGHIIYVLTGVVSMEHIWRIMNTYRMGKEGFFYLLNENGQILSGPDTGRILDAAFSTDKERQFLKKEFGTIRYRLDNRDYFCVLRTKRIKWMDGSIWKIVAVQPYSQVFWVMSYLKLFLIISFVALLVIVSAGSFHQSRKITSPLVTFLEKIEQVRIGDLRARTGFRTDDEVGYLSESFDAMIDSLRKMKEALEDKNRMLENINEELKNQLILSEKASIIGKISSGLSHNLRNTVFLLKNLIRSCAGETDEEKRSSTLGATGSAIDALLTTIDPILYLSRGYKELRETVSLREALREVVAIVTLYFREDSIELKTDLADAPPVNIVAGQIQQAVLNILMNARDSYRSKPGEVFMKLYETKEEGKSIACIQVSDSGSGMDEGQLQKIFLPFYSTKEYSGKLAGIGVGMYISKMLVEASGGTIRVTSFPGKGTDVFIIIPGV
jgi:signal transduction histidine kinase